MAKYTREDVLRIRKEIEEDALVTDEQEEMMRFFGIYPEDGILQGKSWIVQRRIHGVLCKLSLRERKRKERKGRVGQEKQSAY